MSNHKNTRKQRKANWDATLLAAYRGTFNLGHNKRIVRKYVKKKRAEKYLPENEAPVAPTAEAVKQDA